MKFSLIICTYMRPQSVLQLLQSVKSQTLYPNEILIIDGSSSQDTEIILKEKQFLLMKKNSGLMIMAWEQCYFAKAPWKQ